MTLDREKKSVFLPKQLPTGRRYQADRYSGSGCAGACLCANTCHSTALQARLFSESVTRTIVTWLRRQPYERGFSGENDASCIANKLKHECMRLEISSQRERTRPQLTDISESGSRNRKVQEYLTRPFMVFPIVAGQWLRSVLAELLLKIPRSFRSCHPSH